MMMIEISNVNKDYEWWWGLVIMINDDDMKYYD